MSSIDDNVVVELDNIQKELLLTNLDEDGKLSCLKIGRASCRERV